MTKGIIIETTEIGRIMTKKKVLFVCLGNICRSPMAEGIFKHKVEERGLTHLFEIDSAGTAAYHVGNLPDERMRETAYSHGILLNSKARQAVAEDLEEFDLILAMDKSNHRNLLKLALNGNAEKVRLMREFDTKAESMDVPDPYYGGVAGFEEVYQILDRSCNQLLDELA